MTRSLRTLTLTMAFLAIAQPAFAYVGPGAGVSLLGAAAGLIVAILVAFGVIVLWPLRRFMKTRRKATADAPSGDVASAGAEPD